MENEPLSRTNRHLRDAEEARHARARSLASSTAIETGEAVAEIEKKLNQPHVAKIRVTLA